MKAMIASLAAYDPGIAASQGAEWRERDEATREWEDALIDRIAEELRNCIVAGVIAKSAQSITLIVDAGPNPIQDAALKKIKESIVRSIQLEIVPASGETAADIAADVIKAVDSFASRDEIYINVSSVRHGKALGLVYAAAARPARIKELFYIDPQTERQRLLPKLTISLTGKQRNVLRHLQTAALELLERREPKTLQAVLRQELRMRRSTYYSCLDALQGKGLIDAERQLTEAGKVMLL